MNDTNEKLEDNFDDILDFVNEAFNSMIPSRMTKDVGQKILSKVNDTLELSRENGTIYDYATLLRNVVTDTDTSMYVGGKKDTITSKWQIIMLLKRHPKDEYTVLPITFVDDTVIIARCEFRRGWEAAKKTIRAMKIHDVEQEKDAILEVLDNAFKDVKEKVPEIQIKVDIVQSTTTPDEYEVRPMWRLMEADNWDNPWCCLAFNGQNTNRGD